MADKTYYENTLDFFAKETAPNVYEKAVRAGGYTVRIAATITRPSNATQYSAGDQVTGGTVAGSGTELAGAARYAAGAGVIVDARLFDSFNQATKPNLRCYLFSGTAAPAAAADNAAFDPTDADFANCFGFVEFTSWEQGGTTVGGAGNCQSFVRGLNIPFACGAGTTSLWAELVERGTYTPGTAEAFTLELGILQD